LVRALPLQGIGRGFESLCAHQKYLNVDRLIVAQVTVIVSDWVAVPMLLRAVIVNVYVPARVGVPASRAVPLDAVNVTPGGRVPLLVTVAVGVPVVVISKLNAWARVAVTVAGLVIVGAWRTVSANVWFAEPDVFVAVNVSGYTCPGPDGVPESVAVPLVPAVNVTPGGSAPLTLSPPRGKPVVRTVNVNAVPDVEFAVAALVNAGASLTVRVNVWVALVVAFWARNVSE
jgi:hypothetical protein